MTAAGAPGRAGPAGLARVRVPAELTFLLRSRDRSGELTVPVDGTASAVHVLESLGLPRTEVGRILVSGREAAAGTRLRDGDLVVVLPVARPQPLDPQRFLLDVHLGALARRMRLLGLDAAYRNDASDPALVAEAAAQGRTLLTQDRGLLRRRALVSGAYVRGRRPDEQLADVLDRFAPQLRPWTRCPACNGLLEPVPPQEVHHLLEPGTRRSYTAFSRCRDCGRPYWQGAHAARLTDVVDAALAGVRARRPEAGPAERRGSPPGGDHHHGIAAPPRGTPGR
jgi:hypothetical protein